jgi:hypothetical protein
MGRHNAEAGLEHTHADCHELKQGQGVFSARNGYEDAITLLNEGILCRCLVKLVAEAVHE